MRLLLIIVLLSGCASYRIVELERFHAIHGGKDDIVITYAATKNNMIIPELAIDRTGRYPIERTIAEERLKELRISLRELINEKYKTENSFLFQSKRMTFMVGQIIVSPIVIPIMFISDLVHKTVPDDEDTSLLKHYFRQIVNPPVPQKPVVRDELAIL